MLAPCQCLAGTRMCPAARWTQPETLVQAQTVAARRASAGEREGWGSREWDKTRARGPRRTHRVRGDRSQALTAVPPLGGLQRRRWTRGLGGVCLQPPWQPQLLLLRRTLEVCGERRRCRVDSGKPVAPAGAPEPCLSALGSQRRRSEELESAWRLVLQGAEARSRSSQRIPLDAGFS
ncbi:hypothetical protein NDU88_003877 [Pleurodeles waltl]|uniref:Uncharacterized protein n=1 Tax=Pleurodeles waltl TaxID=8319 RepID=A0AAV7V321_PLEWA|nr:hypothetical protein NDU88_003877 [Pleurodeles waltl]